MRRRAHAAAGAVGQPDAYVGIVHRLDTGVSGLMVCARTPKAAAALTRQITQSQEAYAVLDGRAAPPKIRCPHRSSQAVPGRPCAGTDETLPEHGILRDYLFKDSRKGRVFPVNRPRKGVREAVLEYRITASNGTLSLADITLHTGRTHQIRVQFASRSIRSGATANTAAISREPLHCRAHGCVFCTRRPGADGVRIGKAGHGTMERLASASAGRSTLFFRLRLEHSRALLSGERSYGTTTYKTDAAIYDVLEREIIDLTIRPEAR